MIIRYIVLQRANALKWEIILQLLYSGKNGVILFRGFS